MGIIIISFVHVLQQETFTNWVNVRLKSGDKQVTNLAVDLRDGTVLVRLVENLTGKKIKGYHKSPKLPAHMLDNLDLVFKTVQSAGIKVIGMGELARYRRFGA